MIAIDAISCLFSRVERTKCVVSSFSFPHLFLSSPLSSHSTEPSSFAMAVTQQQHPDPQEQHVPFAPLDPQPPAAIPEVPAPAAPVPALTAPQRTTWNLEEDTILINGLLNAKAQGQVSDNGFKKVVFQTIHAQFDKLGFPKSLEACAGRTATIKKDFNVVNTLRNLSGFGWDPETCVVVADDHVWEAYLVLWNNAVATGQDAFRIPDAVQAARSDDSDEPGPPSTPVHSRSTSRLSTTSSTPSTPSSSPSSNTKTSRRGRSTATAIEGMATAVSRLADSITSDTSDIPASPIRRQTAIRAARTDDLLNTPSKKRRVRFIRHFQKDTAAADAYVELQSDPELRQVWLEEEEEVISDHRHRV
ncbi:hypothetical protein BXZ70DRAFT_174295 [Cristinia sonorae]|uniref:Myb/SANT-like domain-containing protein n=1 Tax=Cristinia sonorae TaxID=1940300 RepID=A0A8K0UMW9_9AGAR|nr:hypothetical protein BXZ70DRAFT_174295 [Cristinia sonorae]